jgi:polyhydroxyalkanoate synthesis regulator phasin
MMSDRDSSNVEAAERLAREIDAGPDPDVPSRAEVAAEAHADREQEREHELWDYQGEIDKLRRRVADLEEERDELIAWVREGA